MVVMQILNDKLSTGSVSNSTGSELELLVAEKIGLPRYVQGAGCMIDHGSVKLSDSDAQILREVMWSLVLEGIIIPGINNLDGQFPFYTITSLGREILNGQPYFFHDATTYEKIIRAEIPSPDPVTLTYLKEATHAFHFKCSLSATVMLGVAAEYEFLTLLEVISSNQKWSSIFAKVEKERQVLSKINKFKEICQAQGKSLPPEIKEGFDTIFLGIQDTIRQFRNDSGHPTGKIIPHEQVFILLQLFIPYAKKINLLKSFFAQP